MSRVPRYARMVLAASCLAGLAACGDKPAETAKKSAPATLITTTQARAVTLEVTESTLGSLESVFDPKVSAEIAGRIVRVEGRAGRQVRKGELLAEIEPGDAQQQLRVETAELRRIEALHAQQERVLARQEDLHRRHFVSRNAVDEARAQSDAVAEQLASARARLKLAEIRLGHTRVAAPYDGQIVVQIVAPGDYVKVGDPLFQFVSNRRIRANLPFPEQVSPRIRIGQTVRLNSPQMPGRTIEGTIEDIRPTLLGGSRAIEAIARFDNPGGLLSGGSVDAKVVVARREGAVVVPEQSVVLRQAGKVVFAIADGKAQQHIVETGSKQDGVVEIVRGLAAGTTVAKDGAGFLSQGAAVTIKETASAGTAPKKAAVPRPAG